MRKKECDLLKCNDNRNMRTAKRTEYSTHIIHLIGLYRERSMLIKKTKDSRGNRIQCGF